MTRPDFNVVGSTVYACNKVVEYLKPLLEGGERDIDKVETVERHIGRFDTAEQVKRWLSKRDGGIRIAALNVTAYERIGGRIVGRVNMAAYVFTAPRFGYDKDTLAEVIAGKLVAAMMERNAPPEAYGRAENFRADNLYSTAIDETGMACWAVSWSQQWYLDEPIDGASLDDFLRFGLTGELADGAPVIEGVVDLPQ
ncbi:hypothetical protein [Shewanella algae]